MERNHPRRGKNMVNAVSKQRESRKIAVICGGRFGAGHYASCAVKLMIRDSFSLLGPRRVTP